MCVSLSPSFILTAITPERVYINALQRVLYFPLERSAAKPAMRYYHLDLLPRKNQTRSVCNWLIKGARTMGSKRKVKDRKVRGERKKMKRGGEWNYTVGRSVTALDLNPESCLTLQPSCGFYELRRDFIATSCCAARARPSRSRIHLLIRISTARDGSIRPG